MPKVLVNDFSPTPDRLTGISVYTWKILDAMMAGKSSYVLATNRRPQDVPAAIRTGIEVIWRKVPLNETLAMAQNTVELPRLARAHGCEAIFHPHPVSMLGGLATSAVVVHDLYRVTHPEIYDWRQKIQWRLFVARGIRRAGAVICVSQATKQAVVEAYPAVAARTFVVHEASPIDRPAHEPDRPAGLDGQPYGLIVANLQRNKNIAVVIEALRMMAARGRRPTILLVGRDEIGVLGDLLGASPDIDFRHVGQVSDAELQRLYAGAKVYINASLTEGFCLPILEAHTYGVPVICSDLAVLREVGGEGAMFFDPHSPADLAQALDRIFYEDEAHARLKASATTNAARFSWTRAAAETEQVLAGVARRP